MTAKPISKRQLIKAQVLWSQFARRSLDVAEPDSRDARLRWTADVVKREVESFKDLTRAEAKTVIDALAKATGQFRDRARAKEMGTAGRRRASRRIDSLAGREDLDRIQDALTRLGWDELRLQAWLRSPSSPLRARGGQIRTQADANRVWWALKRMLKEAQKWSA